VRAVSGAGHPLLGDRVAEGAWETTVDLGSAELAYLRDHSIFGFVLLPGAAYAEIGAAVGDELAGDEPRAVADVLFRKALRFRDGAPMRMRVEASSGGADGIEYRVLSRRADGGEWAVNAEGRVVAGGPRPDPFDITGARSRAGERIDGPGHYAASAARGGAYGPAFQGVVEVFTGGNECLGLIEAPAEIDTGPYGIHPAVLDAAVQVPALHLDQEDARLWLPVSLDRLQLYGAVPRRVWTHAVRVNEPADGPRTLRSDVRIVDDDGTVVAEAGGLLARRGGRK
jgi:acyl transferase domain-containing protein